MGSFEDLLARYDAWEKDEEDDYWNWGKREVVRVPDADSLELRGVFGPEEVRLSAIDAPEYYQRGGSSLADQLRSQVLGSSFDVESKRYEDYFGRTVADLRDDQGNSLNEAILAAGGAYPSPYTARAPNAEALMEANRLAQEQGLGVYSMERPPIDPAAFRGGQIDPGVGMVGGPAGQPSPIAFNEPPQKVPFIGPLTAFEAAQQAGDIRFEQGYMSDLMGQLKAGTVDLGAAGVESLAGLSSTLTGPITGRVSHTTRGLEDAAGMLREYADSQSAGPLPSFSGSMREGDYGDALRGATLSAARSLPQTGAQVGMHILGLGAMSKTAQVLVPGIFGFIQEYGAHRGEGREAGVARPTLDATSVVYATAAAMLEYYGGKFIADGILTKKALKDGVKEFAGSMGLIGKAFGKGAIGEGLTESAQAFAEMTLGEALERRGPFSDYFNGVITKDEAIRSIGDRMIDEGMAGLLVGGGMGAVTQAAYESEVLPQRLEMLKHKEAIEKQRLIDEAQRDGLLDQARAEKIEAESQARMEVLESAGSIGGLPYAKRNTLPDAEGGTLPARAGNWKADASGALVWVPGMGGGRTFSNPREGVQEAARGFKQAAGPLEIGTPLTEDPVPFDDEGGLKTDYHLAPRVEDRWEYVGFWNQYLDALEGGGLEPQEGGTFPTRPTNLEREQRGMYTPELPPESATGQGFRVSSQQTTMETPSIYKERPGLTREQRQDELDQVFGGGIAETLEELEASKRRVGPVQRRPLDREARGEEAVTSSRLVEDPDIGKALESRETVSPEQVQADMARFMEIADPDVTSVPGRLETPEDIRDLSAEGIAAAVNKLKARRVEAEKKGEKDEGLRVGDRVTDHKTLAKIAEEAAWEEFKRQQKIHQADPSKLDDKARQQVSVRLEKAAARAVDRYVRHMPEGPEKKALEEKVIKEYNRLRHIRFKSLPKGEKQVAEGERVDVLTYGSDKRAETAARQDIGQARLQRQIWERQAGRPMAESEEGFGWDRAEVGAEQEVVREEGTRESDEAGDYLLFDKGLDLTHELPGEDGVYPDESESFGEAQTADELRSQEASDRKSASTREASALSSLGRSVLGPLGEEHEKPKTVKDTFKVEGDREEDYGYAVSESTFLGDPGDSSTLEATDEERSAEAGGRALRGLPRHAKSGERVSVHPKRGGEEGTGAPRKKRRDIRLAGETSELADYYTREAMDIKADARELSSQADALSALVPDEAPALDAKEKEALRRYRANPKKYEGTPEARKKYGATIQRLIEKEDAYRDSKKGGLTQEEESFIADVRANPDKYTGTEQDREVNGPRIMRILRKEKRSGVDVSDRRKLRLAVASVVGAARADELVGTMAEVTSDEKHLLGTVTPAEVLEKVRLAAVNLRLESVGLEAESQKMLEHAGFLRENPYQDLDTGTLDPLSREPDKRTPEEIEAEELAKKKRKVEEEERKKDKAEAAKLIGAEAEKARRESPNRKTQDVIDKEAAEELELVTDSTVIDYLLKVEEERREALRKGGGAEGKFWGRVPPLTRDDVVVYHYSGEYSAAMKDALANIFKLRIGQVDPDAGKKGGKFAKYPAVILIGPYQQYAWSIDQPIEIAPQSTPGAALKSSRTRSAKVTGKPPAPPSRVTMKEVSAPTPGEARVTERASYPISNLTSKADEETAAIFKRELEVLREEEEAQEHRIPEVKVEKGVGGKVVTPPGKGVPVWVNTRGKRDANGQLPQVVQETKPEGENWQPKKKLRFGTWAWRQNQELQNFYRRELEARDVFVPVDDRETIEARKKERADNLALRTAKALRSAVASGETTGFTGEDAFLANDYEQTQADGDPLSIEHDGRSYSSVERAFLAASVTDEALRDRIATVKDPRRVVSDQVKLEAKEAKAAKKEGRDPAPSKLTPDFKQKQLAVMKSLLRQKFKDPVMLKKLLDTKARKLINVEKGTLSKAMDKQYWGITSKGVGKNYLGQLLQEIRDESRAGKAKHKATKVTEKVMRSVAEDEEGGLQDMMAFADSSRRNLQDQEARERYEKNVPADLRSTVGRVALKLTQKHLDLYEKARAAAAEWDGGDVTALVDKAMPYVEAMEETFGPVLLDRIASHASIPAFDLISEIHDIEDARVEPTGRRKKLLDMDEQARTEEREAKEKAEREEREAKLGETKTEGPSYEEKEEEIIKEGEKERYKRSQRAIERRKARKKAEEDREALAKAANVAAKEEERKGAVEDLPEHLREKGEVATRALKEFEETHIIGLEAGLANLTLDERIYMLERMNLSDPQEYLNITASGGSLADIVPGSYDEKLLLKVLGLGQDYATQCSVCFSRLGIWSMPGLGMHVGEKLRDGSRAVSAMPWLHDFAGVMQSWMTSMGDLAPEMFQRVKEKEGAVALILDDGKRLIRKFDKTLEAYTESAEGKSPSSTLRTIHEAWSELRGYEDLGTSEEAKALVEDAKAMRDFVDGLSKRVRDLKLGEKLTQIVTDHLGFYLNRSYRAHDRPTMFAGFKSKYYGKGWLDEIQGTKEWDAAVKYFLAEKGEILNRMAKEHGTTAEAIVEATLRSMVDIVPMDFGKLRSGIEGSAHSVLVRRSITRKSHWVNRLTEAGKDVDKMSDVEYRGAIAEILWGERFAKKMGVDKYFKGRVEAEARKAGKTVESFSKGMQNNAEIRSILHSEEITHITKMLDSATELAPQLRAVLGEYTDPRQSFLSTIHKVGQIIEQTAMDRSIVEMGLASGRFVKTSRKEEVKERDPKTKLLRVVETKEVANAYAGLSIKKKVKDISGKEYEMELNMQVPASSSSPYAGILMSREDYDALVKADLNKANAMVIALMKFNAMIKEGKTVFSVQTQVRNYVANLSFLVAMGVPLHESILATSTFGLGTREGKGANKVMADMLLDTDKNKDADEKLDALWRDFIEDNLGGTGGLSDLLAAYGQHDRELHEAPTFLNGGISESMGMKAVEKLRKARTKMRKGYQAGDDFFKFIAYSHLRKKLAENNPLATKESIRKRAAWEVKNLMPNYDMLSKAMQAIRQNIAIGAFPAFTAESVRSLKNIMLKAAEEAGSDWAAKHLKEEIGMPDLKDKEGQVIKEKVGKYEVGKIGLPHRMANILAAKSLMAGLTTVIVQLAGAAFPDMDDDETEEMIQRLAPSWSKNSSIIPIAVDKETGILKYVDMSFSDPFNYPWRMLQAAGKMTDPAHGTFGERFVSLVFEASDDFLGPEIGSKNLAEMITGLEWMGNDSGNFRRYVSSDAPAIPGLVDRVARFIGETKPGFVTQLQRLIEASEFSDTLPNWRGLDLSTEALATFAGIRITTMDLKREIDYAARDLAKGGQLARSRERMLSTPEGESPRLVSRFAGDPKEVAEDTAANAARIYAARIEAIQKLTGWSGGSVKKQVKRSKSGLAASQHQAAMKKKSILRWKKDKKKDEDD